MKIIFAYAHANLTPRCGWIFGVPVGLRADDMRLTPVGEKVITISVVNNLQLHSPTLQEGVGDA